MLFEFFFENENFKRSFIVSGINICLLERRIRSEKRAFCYLIFARSKVDFLLFEHSKDPNLRLKALLVT